MSKLTFIEYTKSNKFGHKMANYKCECGNVKEICVAFVTSGHTKSCGCFAKIKNPRQYLGQKFGKLTFMAYEVVSSNKKRKALFKCDCGVEKEFKLYAVLKGQIKSCGCHKLAYISEKNTSHGLCKHPLYSTWNGIIGRCYNDKNERYKDYGGRGVIMCNEWRNDFMSFYNWAITNGWKQGLQIDKDIKARRIGKEGLIYSPDMCSIVTRTENLNSTRSNKYLTFNDAALTVSQWAHKLNIDAFLIYKRLRRGWAVEKVLTTKNLRNFKRKSVIKYSFGYIN